jgi:phage-related protein
MSSAKPKPRYRVLPLPRVQREAKKMLTTQQLREGVGLAKCLRYYPNVPELGIEPCGAGMELRVETRAVNIQGWLRAIFWVHEKSRTVYIVDLFWKKSNSISKADRLRADDRIRRLEKQLEGGADPWVSAK